MSGGRVRILVVDDNELNLELVTVVLETAGYEVSQATSAAEGLEAARREPPQLILMDLGMPGMDGYAALRALREDPITAGLPVVALTAYAMPSDEQRVVEAGFDGYLTKPIDVRSLSLSVAEHLAGKRNGG